jgi:hypothetical protein
MQCGIFRERGAVRKERAVLRGEKAIGLAAAALLVCAVAVVFGRGVARGAAQDEQVVGRYQMAVPDLILDTATGKLADSRGQVLEQPIDPSGSEPGRYTVDGYVTAVTRWVGLDVIQSPIQRVELVKGYVLGDTKTGRIIKQRIYYSRAIQEGDL